MKLKYADFPKVFNHHVIIDTRTMVADHIQASTSSAALALHVQNLGEVEFDRLPEADRKEIAAVLIDGVSSMLTNEIGYRESIYDVIKAGPFQLTGGTLAQKNVDFCLARFIQLATGIEKTLVDVEAAAVWLEMVQEQSRVLHDAKIEENIDELVGKIATIFGNLH